MKLIHIVNLAAAVFIIFGCYLYSIKKAGRHSIQKSLSRVLKYSTLGVAAYTLAMTSTVKLIAYICYCAYHILIIAVVMAFAVFIREYTGVKPLIKNEIHIIGFASSADVILIALNPFIHWMFRLSEKHDAVGKTYYFISHREKMYIFHFLLVYIIIMFSVVTLLRKLFSSPRIYKLKYATILLMMIGVAASHILYINLDYTFDYSVIFYAFIAVAIFYFSVFYIPRGLMEKLLFFTIANMKDGIICVDIDGRISHSNKTAREYCGESKDDHAVAEYVDEWFREHPEASADDEVTWNDKRKIDGEKRHFINDYKRIYDNDGKYVGCFFIFHDRTMDYKRLAEEKYRASHDYLTGLYNKEHFCREASELMKRNANIIYLIICADVKSFKIINDIFGVHRGDDLLLSIAGTVSSLTAPHECVCGRLSGDRFAVCIKKESYNEQLLLSEAERLRGFFGKDSFKVQTHFGVYEVTDPEMSVSVMCDRASFAIHTIKDSYHSIIAYYTDELRDRFLSEQKMISEFEAALSSGQFTAYIQPQISSEGRIRGGEALVRWIHPVEGIISPGRFIETFEQTGLISRLDSYMWELACIQLNKWRMRGLKDNYLSVNISNKDFFLMDVYGTLTSLVEKYSLEPGCLHLEITETAVMNISDKQQDLISQLRDYGFIVEIDDFGSGYSSLNTLKDLYVDVLKIDMGFLEKTENTMRSMTILRMVIGLAKALDMAVITEGVETREQALFLKECGCDVFQGYFFAKPMKVSEFEERFLRS